MNIINHIQTGSFTSFDGTPIYYESRGEGEPIIFVYGIGCLMNHWHHQVSYFSKNYRVITFDIRGHHKSTPLAEPNNLSMGDLSKDIHALLEHLNISSAHFVGHSFGAPVILKYFEDAPDKFKSIVFINGFAKNPIKGMFGLDLIEPFYYFVKAQYQQAPDLWTTLWRLAIDNPVSMRLAALAGGFNIKLTQFKDIEVYARGVARLDLKTFLVLFEEMMIFNGDDILPKISVPTLIVSGENDAVTPQHFQKQLHDNIKNSELLKVPYGSHCTQLDFPDFINLKLEQFWATK